MFSRHRKGSKVHIISRGGVNAFGSDSNESAVQKQTAKQLVEDSVVWRPLSRLLKLGRSVQTAAMNRIQGVKRLSHSNSVAHDKELPEFGIEVAKTKELAQVTNFSYLFQLIRLQQ